MGKIIKPEQASKIALELRKKNKSIVLAGGCFDLLHIGHITFFEKAKEAGDILFVFLESDETIKKSKGAARPINSQKDRAKILSALEIIDFVILLPTHMTNDEYDSLITNIKPAVLATTQGDTNRAHKERQAKLIDGKVIDVIQPVENQSTTRLINILEEI